MAVADDNGAAGTTIGLLISAQSPLARESVGSTEPPSRRTTLHYARPPEEVFTAVVFRLIPTADPGCGREG
eukprot:1017894-Prorocentrum_minimum.AAC.3